MIDFRIERGWSFDGYRAWVIDYRNDKAFVAKPLELEFVEHKEYEVLPKPTFEVGGILSRELIQALKKGLAGFTAFDNKEEYETAKRVEKAMQEHINFLKLVVDRVVK